jgi:predicted CoA-binding protein
MDETRIAANAFLGCRRIAVVGHSRDPRSFSRMVADELRRRGYDVVPVNPRAGEVVDGLRCAARVQDVAPPPEAALLFTPPVVSEQVVRDCAEAGVRHVWMHRGMGPGAASAEAIAYCRSHGIDVVTDACVFMHLPDAGVVHRAHGWGRRLFGGRVDAGAAASP